jgi:ribosomal protein S20
MSQNIAVKGLRELSRQFDQFNRNMHTELKGVVKETIREVAKEAKAAAPVRTGEYKRSIAWAVARSGLIAWAYAQRQKREGAGRSKMSYIGHLLEYGTKFNPRTGKGNRPYPHFGPAMAKAKALFGARLEAAVGRIRGVM